jgi:hypothetical protein
MLLLTSCRGHTGEITDVVLSWDDAVSASSSNDCTIRCWDLQARRGGPAGFASKPRAGRARRGPRRPGRG